MNDRVIENDIDLDEMTTVPDVETTAERQQQQRTDSAPDKSTDASVDRAAAKPTQKAERTTKVPTLMPDKGASLWDDDPVETARESDVTGREEPDDNDEEDAGDDDTSEPAAKSDKGEKDAAKADKEPIASDPTSWGVYKRLVSALEAKLKNTVTAANYEKELKRGTDQIKAQLSRYKSPEDFMLAGWHAQQRIRSGELAPKTLRKDATPAEVKAWREANGIPEKPEAYTVPQVAGHDWQEHDAPVLNAFKSHFHKAGLSQKQVDTVLSAYAQELQSAYKARDQAFAALDRDDAIHMEETLRADPDIGNAEYRPTLTLVKRLLNDREYMPQAAAEKLKRARDAQGHLVMNDPDVVKFLRKIADDRYGGADSEERRIATHTQLSSRKAEIEKIMREDINTYYRDQAMQDEYSQILNAEQGVPRSRRR